MLAARSLQAGVVDPWSLTPGELACIVSGAEERENNRSRNALAGAWFDAVLSRLDRIPALPVVLGDKTEEELKLQALEEERSHYQELADYVRPPGSVEIVG